MKQAHQVLAVFKSTSDLMEAHLLLENGRAAHNLVPTPPGYGGSCGISLIADAGHRKKVESAGRRAAGKSFRVFSYRPKPPAPLYGWLEKYPVRADIKEILRKASRGLRLAGRDFSILGCADSRRELEALRLTADCMRRETSGGTVQLMDADRLEELRGKGLKIGRLRDGNVPKFLRNGGTACNFVVIPHGEGLRDECAVARVALRSIPVGVEIGAKTQMGAAGAALASGASAIIIKSPALKQAALNLLASMNRKPAP